MCSIKWLNIDIDQIVSDFELCFKTKNDNFIKEINRLSDEKSKEYAERVKEHKKILSMRFNITRLCNIFYNMY